MNHLIMSMFHNVPGVPRIKVERLTSNQSMKIIGYYTIRYRATK
jgi:hypothetical protein